MTKHHHRILIVGGAVAGISARGALARHRMSYRWMASFQRFWVVCSTASRSCGSRFGMGACSARLSGIV